tara:strand:- start:366 stop:1721 length:1356 start_codon:yes stop_codon:yes gene_type:complete
MKHLTFLFLILSSAAVSAQVELMAEKFQRLNDPGVTTRSEDRLTLDVLSEGEFLLIDNTEAKFDGSFRLYIDDQEFSYSISEAFLESSDGTNSFSVGRKVVDWNSNEVFWGLNHLNSRRSFTLLDEKREGLIGFHYDRKMGDLEFNFILSYLYVPQLNPGLKVENGAVVSKSEWVRRPPTSTMVNDKSVPIYYNLNEPALSDVLLNKTIGANLTWNWGEKKTAGKLNSYILYKPENSLRINAEAYYDLDLKQVTVNANPVVNHHAVLGVGFEQGVDVGAPGTTKLLANFEVIDPNAKLGKDFAVLDPIKMKEQNREFNSEFFKINPNYKRESHFTLALNHSNNYFDIGLNYFGLLTEASTGDDFYSDTARFENAVGIWLEARPSERLTWLIDLKHDLNRSDIIVRTDLAYRFTKNTLGAVGVEALVAPKAESFWSSYRANDSVYFSFGYVF